jgi:hypothetical protein
VPVAGGVPDPQQEHWYRRTEPLSITIEGSLTTRTIKSMVTTPIPHNTPADSPQAK